MQVLEASANIVVNCFKCQFPALYIIVFVLSKMSLFSI